MRALMIGLGVAAMLAAAVLAVRENVTQRPGLPAVLIAASSTPSSTRFVIRPATATPQPRGSHPVYVLDVHNGRLLSDLHVVDADAQKDISILPLRYSPEIAFSPDGAKMYVLDSYYTKATRGDWREVLSLFDTYTFEMLIDDVPVPKRLLYKVFPESNEWFFPSVDGRYLFVAKYGAPDVHALRMTVLGATTLQIVAEYAYPSCEDGRLWALANGQLSCASSAGPDFAEGFDFVDPLTGTRTRALDLAPGTEAAQTLGSRDGNRIYRISKDNRVSVVDMGVTPPRALVAQAQLQTPSEHSFGWARQLVLSPDGSRLFVGFVATSGEFFGSGISDVIWAYDTKTWQRVGEFKPSDPAWNVAVSNDGSQIYTVNPEARSLSIFDTTTYRRLGVMHNFGESPAQIIVPPAPR